MITIIIPGRCQPKQRPRRGIRGTWYTPKPTLNYEREVGWQTRIEFKGRQPFAGAVSVWIDIIEAIPKSWASHLVKKALDEQTFPGKCDLDNKIKSLLDGMNGIAYKDDKQVSKITASHKYGKQAMVILKIEEVNPSIIC